MLVFDVARSRKACYIGCFLEIPSFYAVFSLRKFRTPKKTEMETQVLV